MESPTLQINWPSIIVTTIIWTLITASRNEKIFNRKINLNRIINIAVTRMVYVTGSFIAADNLLLLTFWPFTKELITSKYGTDIYQLIRFILPNIFLIISIIIYKIVFTPKVMGQLTRGRPESPDNHADFMIENIMKPMFQGVVYLVVVFIFVIVFIALGRLRIIGH